MAYKITKSDAEWKAELSDLAYHVLREKGTERPFVGEYTDTETEGTYACGACHFELFSSEHKFHSGCGWPSFWSELESASIEHKKDTTYGMTRTELLCSNCGSHLGHIFNDGPRSKGGMRYCINSVSMIFTPKNVL
jgi:peptide-methionine (R)-S-oxide reductase